MQRGHIITKLLRLAMEIRVGLGLPFNEVTRRKSDKTAINELDGVKISNSAETADAFNNISLKSVQIYPNDIEDVDFVDFRKCCPI